jgi:hypothetical protein
MHRTTLSSASSVLRRSLYLLPIWHRRGKRSPAVSPLLPVESRASCEVGEQLMRARRGCIGAPAGMQRRQSALAFSRFAEDRK